MPNFLKSYPGFRAYGSVGGAGGGGEADLLPAGGDGFPPLQARHGRQVGVIPSFQRFVPDIRKSGRKNKKLLNK